MSNTAISEYSATASDNTEIGGIGIQGTNDVRNFDNAFREQMAQLADMNAGTSPLDDTFTLMDPADNTKKFRFDGGLVSAGTTRTMTVPNANTTLAGLSVAQTFTATQTINATLAMSTDQAITFAGTGASTTRTNLGMGSATDTSGTALLPAYAFAADPDTGMFRIGANSLGFATAGTQQIGVSAGSVDVAPPILGRDGSAANPGYAFTNDPDTGLYRTTTNSLGLSAGGTLRVTVSTSAVTFALPTYALADSAATPSYTYADDPDTGMFRSGANVLGLATAGTSRMTISATSATFAQPLYGPDGTAGAPAFTFANDPDTGVFLVSANSLGLSAGGTALLTINSSFAQFNSDPRIGTFSTTGATAGINISAGSVVSSVTATTASNQYRFYNPNGQVGSIVTTGTATAFNTSSDGQLKVNRADLADEMDVGAIFDALSPQAYDWLNDRLEPTGERGFGLIAQEAYEIVPSAVSVGNSEPGQDDYQPWAIDYSKFVPLLIAEIKALRSRVAALEA